MSNLTCIIIEDEPLAVKTLTDYIQKVPSLELKEVFKDALLATAYLREQSVDLIFLDIHLPRLKGMAFIKTLVRPPAIIITTAYHQYAVEGFDLNVADYLLKPYSFERFLAAVNKVNRQHPGQNELKDYIVLSVQKRKIKIRLADIVYLESQREYVKIVCTTKTLLTRMSTQEIEALLPSTRFKRIHRSFIVCLARIESYTSDQVEINGYTLPIGRGYQSSIGKFFDN